MTGNGCSLFIGTQPEAAVTSAVTLDHAVEKIIACKRGRTATIVFVTPR